MKLQLQKQCFKGLAASGWHTAPIAMSLAPKPILARWARIRLFEIGFDELPWLVRPDDVLHLEGEIVSLARSKTTPPRHGTNNGHCTSRLVNRFTHSRRLPFASPHLCRPHGLDAYWS